jgi:chromosome segregation ATPase
MKKPRLSARRLSWVALTMLLLGIVTYAFSQLESSPPTPALDGKGQVTAIRQSLETLDARMSDLAKAQARLRLRSETDRIARNLEQARNGIPASLGQASKNLSTEVSKLGEELSAVERELDRRQGETARTLSGIEGRLEETKGIFNDALDNTGGNPDEALPILQIVSENLDRVDNELSAVAQLVKVGEQEGSIMATALSNKVSGILDQVAQSRLAGEKSKESPSQPEVALASNPRGISDAVKKIEEDATASRFKPSIFSEGADIGSARQTAAGRRSSASSIEELRAKLASSHNLQVALSEDTEKLQSDLRRAYREIVSLQTSVKESERLVGELEESRMALLKTRGQNASGVEAVSRMVSRLEAELKTSREELKLARQSLLSEQDRSNTMIRTLSNELERTRKELDSARAAAMSSGADASRLLVLQQELERTQTALQEAKSVQASGNPALSGELRDELRKALVEITRLEAELTGKEELESQLSNLRRSMTEVNDQPGKALVEIARLQEELKGKEELETQLTALRQTMKQIEDKPTEGVSAEYINNLLLELNAAKLAVSEAQADGRELRAQLAESMSSLNVSVGQSHQDLDSSRSALENARAIMARKEFEFASTIKSLEEELQQSQIALQEATQGAIRKVPVVGDMEQSLSESQSRIDDLVKRFDTEQGKAGELVSALQVELEATKRRHQSSLVELSEKDKLLKGQEFELRKVRDEATAVKDELAQVQNIADQLSQLNEVLDETKKTQYSQVSDADRIIASLREQLNESQVELVFAKEAKEKAEEQSASQVSALEHQLEQTREQLAATQATMYDRTDQSKGLIQDLKNELDETRIEIARLKTAGSGNSIEAQQAVAQLQEALGTIRVLQESLDQADQVNGEVDGLRSELANAMQSQLADLERSELEKERLRKNISDLQLEVEMLAEDGAGRNVNYAKSFARLNEQLLSSQGEVAKLEARLAQTENLGVGTITSLEEQLELSRNRVNELEGSVKDVEQGKGNIVDLLERELVMTKRKLDELEARQGTEAPEVANLERRLISAKLQLDELAKQRDDETGEGDLTERLKEQLLSAEAKLAELELNDSLITDGDPANLVKFNRLEQELVEAQNTISSLQSIVEAKDLERELAEAKLAKSIKELESLPQAGDQSTSLRKELDDLRSQLAEAVSRQPESYEPDLRVAELRGEIESLKAELELARELAARAPAKDPEVAKLQSQLADKYGEVLELETDLQQANERLAAIGKTSPNQPSVELEELNQRLAYSLAQFEAAELAKAAAEKKVLDLTEALNSSQGLRDDLVQLQQDLALAKSQLAQSSTAQVEALQGKLDETRGALTKSEAQVSELQGLGNDLLLLQQDLATAKAETAQGSVNSPTPALRAELEQTRLALRKSDNDVLQLNAEFKRSLEDFAQLKNSVAFLESENARLKGGAASIGASASDVLARENATLRAQVQQRDASILSLRENMARVPLSGVGSNEGELRARILQAEGQAEVARNAEQSAKMNFERTDADLKEANRRLIVLEEDLRVARARSAELDAARLGTASVSPGVPDFTGSSPVGTSLLKKLSEENERLKNELTLSQSSQGNDALSRELQEERQKNLISGMQIERERAKINDLQNELQASKQVKRETFERERAQQQQIALQDNELKVSRDRVSQLEGAVVSLRDAIRVLRGGGSSGVPIRSLSSSTPSSASTSRTSFPSLSSGRGVGGGFAATSRVSSVPSRIDPLPLPSRNGRGFRRSTIPPAVSSKRPAIPVVRSVPTGDGNLEVNANVQFLNNKVRPASDIEFFVLREDLETIVKRSGVQIPVQQGIKNAAELWARSIQSGYRYPGVAAHIRNALADSNLARIKTDARGLAKVSSLAPGTYHIIGTAPLGQVGVVWSKSFNIESGKTNQLNLDLRGAFWAQ